MMLRTISCFFRISAWAALLGCAIAGVPGRAAEPDMTGVWEGKYAAIDSAELVAQARITIKRSGNACSGTISLIDEKITVPIRDCEVDDGFLSVSGPMTARGAESGRVGQVFVAFGGFVDPDGVIWEGTWTVSDRDGNVGGGNIFALEREGGPPAPVGGGLASKLPKKPGGNLGNLVGTKPKTPKPAPSKPAPDGGSDEPSSPYGRVSMAGHWEGTYTTSSQSSGTMTIDLARRGASYAGDGLVVADDGTEMPPLVFTSGKMSGKKFGLDGEMTVETEDGEEFPATVGMTGDVNGDAWRGTLLVKVNVEGEETAIVSARFRLQRAADDTPAPKPAPKPEIKASGKVGGGISGRGRIGGIE